MNVLNRFLINELYFSPELKEEKYKDCIATINECGAVEQKLDFIYKIRKFLSCLETPLDGGVVTWGILALSDLEDEIFHAIKHSSTGNSNSNPLDLELNIALNLPGEHIKSATRSWNHGLKINSEDDHVEDCVEQAKKSVLARIDLMKGMKQRRDIEELRAMSQLYADVLIVFLSVKDNY